jgi:hypothetical protein
MIGGQRHSSCSTFQKLAFRLLVKTTSDLVMAIFQVLQRGQDHLIVIRRCLLRGV